jgi:5-methylcytosine-specific restriction endonuclease McrA
MTTSLQSFADLSDGDLLATVHRLAIDERRATASLIASLAELDERRLYLAEGYSSLFTYCTRVLHLSEHAAYGRIEAARVARKYPVFLERLAAGDLTLTTIGLLAPHLTSENHLYLVETARHQSKRDVEHLVASLRPQPAVPSVVRKLPPLASQRPPEAVQTCPANPLLPRLSTPVSSAPAFTEPKAIPALVKPLAAERYKVQFTVSRETFEKLRRVQDLMRHTCPDGDVGIVFERALTMLLQHLEETKLAHVSRPQRPRGTTSGSRRIPSAVRRAVWTRDDGQCAFIGARGRCTERGFLEFHHVIPFADGGLAVVDNIQLRCRAHNQYELDRWFGTQDPPVVRERRDFSGWSNSVRTESPVMSDRRRPMTAVGDKKCQNFSLATVMSRVASAGCLSVTDRLGAHSRSVTACAAH